MSTKIRRYALSVGVFLLSVVFLPSIVSAQEAIDSFVSDITINEDGTVGIVEEIVYDFGANARHGIFRTLKSKHPQEASVWYKNRVIEYDVVSVAREGVSEPYVIEGDADELLIRIGDADRTITGVHAYRVELVLHGALSYNTSEGAELYYNVTGNEWEVPMKSVRVALHDPQSILRTERSCYRGPLGSTESCEDASTESSTVFAAHDLSPYEGVTIAQAIDETKVARLVRERFDAIIVFLACLPILLMWLLWFGSRLYVYERFFRPKNPVIAEYEPYPGILPLYTGVLMDGGLDPKDITAGIVYLAQQGYLKIRKTERKLFFLITLDDYELELRKVADTNAPESARALLSLIFSEEVVGEKVTLSSIKGDKSKQRTNHAKIIEIQAAAAKDLLTTGFYERLNMARFRAFTIPTLIVLGIIVFIGTIAYAAAIALAGIAVTAYIVGLAVIFKRRTIKGYEALFHLKGFKLFLSVTDTERFAFHNAPQKSPELFMEYLPYAIALGVEQQWAKVFADITLPSPAWYDGNGTVAFSAVALSDSLNGFASALASSSASSGGGSSGGGGGGGGGGSW